MMIRFDCSFGSIEFLFAKFYNKHAELFQCTVDNDTGCVEVSLHLSWVSATEAFQKIYEQNADTEDKGGLGFDVLIAEIVFSESESCAV